MFTLPYGAESKLDLELPDTIEVFDCSAPHGDELPDAVEAVERALADPINFPPLNQATVPGDRVVVTVDQAVPQAASVLTGVIRTMLRGETRAEDITVLTDGSADFAAQLLALLPDDVRYCVKTVIHDPDDGKSMAYLAISTEGKPIHVNRVLTDADVLIPIGVLRLDSTLAYHGASGSLFPLFSDRPTQQRFCRAEDDDRDGYENRLRAESREAAWLLGALLTVQVIPGRGESILSILAGDIRTINKRGREACERAWQFPIPRRAGIVVATVGGGTAQQTWEGFARALDVALNAVAERGAVVLCTSLAVRPGPALRRLTSWSEEGVLPKRIRRDLSGDGLSAAKLADAREHVHVYLMSSLSGNHVEQLGIAPVSSAQEIERLCRHFDSCVLLGNAQYAQITVEG